MAKAKFKSVDDYIAAQPAPTRNVLSRVRATIRKAVPDAQEVLAYHIAGYKLGGRALLYFAGWKAHYSLYPASRALIAKFTEELAPYEIEKSTLRFPLDRPVPIGLIGRIANFRAEERSARAAAPAAAGRKRKPSRPN